MQSSYQLDIEGDTNLRPSYQNGYFVQDYVYKESGDLDEHNGKFVKNTRFSKWNLCLFFNYRQNY